MTLRIAHQLGMTEDAWLRSVLPSDASLFALPEEAPWAVPDGTEILFVGNGLLQTLSRDRPDWADSLRWVHIRPTGIDAAPDWLLSAPHVTVSRGASAGGIAEYVLSAMLDFARPVTSVRDPSGWVRPQVAGLEGRSLGLFCYGTIGQAIAARARPFGMTVCAHRRNDGPTEDGTRILPLETLCAESEHLVICAPLTEATRDIFDDALFALCRPGQHLINVARGPMIVPEALRRALDGPLARATLDVWTEEPPPEGHWVYRHPRIRLTPHCSFLSERMGERHRSILLENLEAWRESRPEDMFGRVARSAGY